MSYQSPIVLNKNDIIYINQNIETNGINKGAIYDKRNKVYNVVDKIIVELNNKTYKLIEYHFHIPSEHFLHNRRYPGEIHYVCVEINEHQNETPDGSHGHEENNREYFD